MVAASDRTAKRRAKKEARRFPDAVAAMYDLLKDFDAEDRGRVIGAVEVLLRVEVVHAG